MRPEKRGLSALSPCINDRTSRPRLRLRVRSASATNHPTPGGPGPIWRSLEARCGLVVLLFRNNRWRTTCTLVAFTELLVGILSRFHFVLSTLCQVASPSKGLLDFGPILCVWTLSVPVLRTPSWHFEACPVFWTRPPLLYPSGSRRQGASLKYPPSMKEPSPKSPS